MGVELHDQQQHQILERALVLNDGSFEFRNVPPGNYEVRLVNRYGDRIQSEYMNLNQGDESITFQIGDPDKKAAIGGPVSIGQLEHHVNRKAMHEYRLATKAYAAGDSSSFLPHLEKAIEADPEFAPAHHELGVALMARGETAQAVEEFKRATALDPNLTVGHANLAIALMKLERYEDAETAARRALKLEPGLPKAHYLLALSLLRQHKLSKEVMVHLRAAYDDFPEARTIGTRLEARFPAAR